MLTSTAAVEPPVLPIEEGRKFLGGIGRSKFYELSRAGKIEIISVGGRSVAVVDSLKRYIAAEREAAAARRGRAMA
jgi:hypothetical protein